MSKFVCASALVLAVLVLACTSAAADDHKNDNIFDCLTKFGPGCLECVNVTVTSTPHRLSRRLMSDNHGGEDDDNHPPGPPTNRTILACAACDVLNGYTLVAGEQVAPAGKCKCAPGWGVVYDPLTNPNNSDDGVYTCANCTLDNKVPLTSYSGVKAAYKDGAWTIVPKSLYVPKPPKGTVRSPYYEGQCVSCPAGYAPNATSTKCVKV